MKNFIKENWFKLFIAFILLLNSYYLIVYLKAITLDLKL